MTSFSLRTEKNTNLGPWSSALYVGSMATVLWAPVAFGSVEPWAVGLLRLAALALVAVWAVGCAARGAFVVASSPLQLAVFAAAGLALLQSLPLVGGAPVSVDPYATGQAAGTILAMGVLFSVALVALDRRSRLARAAAVLFWLGFGLSVLAIVQSLSGTSAIYWVRESSASFFGPFANKNHFAGLMEVLLPMGLGPLAAGAIARERRLLVAFAAAVIGTAVVLSQSRGGLLAVAAGVVFLGILTVVSAPVHGSGRARTVAVGAAGGAALAACMAVGVLWVGSDAVVTSLADLPGDISSESATSRSGIWHDSLPLVAARPLLGSGVGAFGEAFSSATASSGSAQVRHAHNDYLQVLVDAGAAGALLAILFAVGIGAAVVRGVRRRDPTLRGVALGASAGCFGLMVHSFVDFNMQIPSNALAFLFAAALVVRAATADGLPERIVKGER
jgi:O-antigen ligase